MTGERVTGHGYRHDPAESMTQAWHKARDARLRIGRALNADNPDWTLPGASLDAAGGDGPGDPTFTAVARGVTTRLQIVHKIAEHTLMIGEALSRQHAVEAQAGIDEVRRIADLTRQQLDDLDVAAGESLLAQHDAWWLAYRDLTLEAADEPLGWDKAKMAATVATGLAHMWDRWTRGASVQITTPNHPKADRQEVRLCRCDADCCPRGCGDKLVAQQDRKVYSERCRKRMQRAKENA